MSHKSLSVVLSLSLLLGTVLPLPVQAETVAANPPSVTAASDGYAMMNWLGSLSIVEQLQTIHRLGENASPQALYGLITALQSPFPLARRKAARSLLDRALSGEREEKHLLAQELLPTMGKNDPIVQKNIIRILARLNMPESQETLRQFFRQSDKETQLNAVEALVPESEQHQNALQLINQVSPYTEVRQAATHTLE